MANFDFYIVYAVIVFAAFSYIYSYAMIVKHEKSYFNVLVPAIFFQAPIFFILEPLNIAMNGLKGSVFAYSYSYACYIVQILIFSLAYRYFKPINSRFINSIADSRENKNIGYAHIILLVLSCLLMLPILYEYRELLGTPRKIYENTRTGYGIFIFTSSLLNNLAFIVFLFLKRKTSLGSLMFLVVLFANVYFHGSKGQFITILMIYFAYITYVLGRKMSGRKFLVNFGVTAGFLISLFAVFAAQQGNFIEVIVNISNYSDYTRNGNKVIDSDFPPQYGKLVLEQNIYSRVPRAIYSDKPKDFGYFILAKTFYPEWFENDTGSPAFGIGGVWADFGIFSIIYFFGWALILGVLVKTLVVKLRKTENMGIFVLVLFFMGIELIPLGGGYLAIEHLFLAILFSLFSSKKIKRIFYQQEKKSESRIKQC